MTETRGARRTHPETAGLSARRPWIAGLALVLLPVLVSPGGRVAAAAEAEDFSEANRMLFFTDHLDGVAADTVLEYEYRKLRPVAESFEDTVSLTVKRPAGGAERSATVHVRYLSGPRERMMAPFENATGNPILLLFLQRDAYEMAQRSGGSVRHFQNQIKTALEEKAELTPVTVDVEGKRFEGTRIRIVPFVDDPYRERFIDEADKVYDFTLSPALPGEFYELRSAVPPQGGEAGSAEPEVWEVIRYRGPLP